MKKSKFICLILLSFSVFSEAFSDDNFKCKITEAYTLEPNGKLDSTTEGAKTTLNSFSEFNVNRKTGELSGNMIFNANAERVSIQVFDDPERIQNYKALVLIPPFSVIEYIEVKQGLPSDFKPFVHKDAWGNISTGLCTYQ